jgi:MoaA/NifB/PqqE/SkfB family radical SAM enzyme
MMFLRPSPNVSLMVKYFKLAKDIAFSNVMRLRMPYKATFAVTYRCNLRCEMCHIWKQAPQEEMSLQDIEKIFKNVKSLSWIDLTGGEISLRDDIVDIAKVILSSSRKIAVFHLSTNGQLPERVFLLVKEISKYGVVPVVNISIDGPPQINDKLRGTAGAYAKSVETFKRLKSLRRSHSYVSCTLSRCNLHHAGELLSALERDIPGFKPKDLHFNLFHRSSHYYKNYQINGLEGVTFQAVSAYFDLSASGNVIKYWLEKAYRKGLSAYMRGNKFPVRCQALRSSCFIDPSGRVYPCGMYERPVGELKGRGVTLGALWNSAECLMARRDIEQQTCQGCWSPCEAYPALLGGVVDSLFRPLAH